MHSSTRHPLIQRQCAYGAAAPGVGRAAARRNEAAHDHPAQCGHTVPHDDDPLLAAVEAAAEVRLSLAAFWRAVAARRLPAPLYPLPRAPRWRRSELREALEATRALPAAAKAARIATRLSQAGR